MKSIVFVLLIVFATAAGAKDKKPQAPKIPDDLQHRIWRGEAEHDAALLMLARSPLQQAVQKTEETNRKVWDEWVAACGVDFQPGSGKDGEPACVDKPVPPVPPVPHEAAPKAPNPPSGK